MYNQFWKLQKRGMLHEALNYYHGDQQMDFLNLLALSLHFLLSLFIQSEQSRKQDVPHFIYPLYHLFPVLVKDFSLLHWGSAISLTPHTTLPLYPSHLVL
eukprot:Phypoly_transcript_12794.p1 GENE.Phypoly_transcript_12794~~Phypoly_transcript_12794.p1  ORF type:complete len:100 (-),score=7.30 Phypoly_transcript_12794:348-647(-)